MEAVRRCGAIGVALAGNRRRAPGLHQRVNSSVNQNAFSFLGAWCVVRVCMTRKPFRSLFQPCGALRWKFRGSTHALGIYCTKNLGGGCGHHKQKTHLGNLRSAALIFSVAAWSLNPCCTSRCVSTRHCLHADLAAARVPASCLALLLDLFLAVWLSSARPARWPLLRGLSGARSIHGGGEVYCRRPGNRLSQSGCVVERWR